MKRWLMLLSIALLSNGLSAMEKIEEQGDDWVNVEDDTELVDDDPAELVKDLIAIKQHAEWPEEVVNPMGIQVHGIFTYAEDYPNPNTVPTVITALSQKPSAAAPATLPAPSALVAASALSAGKQSHPATAKSAAGSTVITVLNQKPSAAASATLPTPNSMVVTSALSARKKPKKPRRAIIHSPPASQQASPIAAPHAFAASISAYMTASSSSIATSIDEDRGVSYCKYDRDPESDDDSEKKKNGKQKSKQQNQKNQQVGEGLGASEFVLGVFGFMLGLDDSGE